MSLTEAEQRATKQDLQQNFDRTGLSLGQVAADLKTTPAHVRAVLALNVTYIEEPWILRDYLQRQLVAQHKSGVAYHKLVGEPQQYWFLNQQRIQRGVLAAR
ncbi:DUF2316 family protein [Lactiplantibacillus daowaiensis]|uniref:DUF2316 family protein n=1 Tax=Lactiplantibacillus daowaiensis TaxID=2559918 RepID=A0ABW1S306_9LACO|nr:DUF2316 family protein [Lactiplantibacillus daowaiensis]